MTAGRGVLTVWRGSSARWRWRVKLDEELLRPGHYFRAGMSLLYGAYHTRSIPSYESCNEGFKHDGLTELLSLVIVFGLFASYCPQVRCNRPIHRRS